MMKISKLCLILVLTLFVSGCTTSIIDLFSEDLSCPTENRYFLDEAATEKVPWKKGQVVARANTYIYYDIIASISIDYPIYRVFLGVLPNGNYLVQEFYDENNRVYTNPYELLPTESMEFSGYGFMRRDSGIEGQFITCYINGKKQEQSIRRNGNAEGESLTWYVNGTLWMKVNMVGDVPNGSYAYWYYNGQKEEEGIYRWAEKVGQSKYWDMSGNKLTYDEFREYKTRGYKPFSMALTIIKTIS